MKYYVLLFFLVGCSSTASFSPGCQHELMQRMYDETYVPWFNENCTEEMLDCSEWFIFVDQYFRSLFNLHPDSYLDPYEIYDYFYDEGAERLYEQEIFNHAWCLDIRRGFLYDYQYQ